MYIYSCLYTYIYIHIYINIYTCTFIIYVHNVGIYNICISVKA